MYRMKGNNFEIFLNLNTVSLSILLAKASFTFLLISMFSYWFQAAFQSKKNRILAKLPLVAMYLANLTLAVLLIIRWVESGHFPLSNLYESLLFLSWSLTSIHLFLENVVNKSEQLTPILTLGAITSPLCLFTNAFATFSLPQEMQKVTVLVPALQSNWLIMHVSVMIISYAALLSGSLLAMAFLVSRFVENTNISKISGNIPFNKISINSVNKAFRNAAYPMRDSYSSQQLDNSKISNPKSVTLPALLEIEQTQQPAAQKKQTLGTATMVLPSVEAALGTAGRNKPYANEALESDKTSIFKKNLPQTLDNLSYRSIGLGFALLTIGILSGAVWANEAWGSYWSWDPKETWAFVTWLVFAFYLHTRISKGWVGKESAFVATFGFAIIWFCYLGVNLFGKGLHSYGWFHTIR